MFFQGENNVFMIVVTEKKYGRKIKIFPIASKKDLIDWLQNVLNEGFIQ
jgi:hypothetical protein